MVVVLSLLINNEGWRWRYYCGGNSINLLIIHSAQPPSPRWPPHFDTNPHWLSVNSLFWWKSVLLLKKFNNKLGEDVDKIDIQEEEGENKHERGYDRLPNFQTTKWISFQPQILKINLPQTVKTPWIVKLYHLKKTKKRQRNMVSSHKIKKDWGR